MADIPANIRDSESAIATSAQEFAARLRQAIGEASIHAFSRRAGISNTALRSYLTGSIPGMDKVVKIAAAAEVNVLWLMTGEGAPHPHPASASPDPDLPSYIPFVDVAVSAGPGMLARDAEVEDAIAFHPQWLRGKINCNPSDLSLVTVRGDSMYPTLQDGDLLLVDRQVAEPRDGIYVFQMEGELLVKRLQRLPGGLFSVISDNPKFSPFSVNPSDPGLDFAIIGRYRGRLSFA